VNAAFAVWRAMTSSRRLRLPDLMVLAGVASATTVVMIVIGMNFGFAERADRAAWRDVLYDENFQEDSHIAQLASTSVYVGGRYIDWVGLAPASPQTPVPPGMDGLPEPGEVFVSPGLARLLDTNPNILGSRTVVGEIGREGLANPNELVVVEGVAPGPFFETPWTFADEAPLAPIGGYLDSDPDAIQTDYRIAALLASVLLLIPALSAVTGVMRMLEFRRGAELATLRLIGATNRTVSTIALLDAVRPAILGIGAGLGVGTGALVVLSRVPVGGSTWYLSDLIPPGAGWFAVLAIVLPTVLVAGVSSVGRATRNPAGVASAAQRPPSPLWRILPFAGALIAFMVVFRGTSPVGLGVLLGVWVALLVAVALLGPLVVKVLGLAWHGLTRSPQGLVASRRLLADPAGAYRLVGAIPLAAFVGLLLAAGTVGLERPTAGLAIAVEAGEVEAVTETLLADTAGMEWTENIIDGRIWLFLEVPDPVAQETMATTLRERYPDGEVVTGAQSLGHADFVFSDDLRRGALVLLLVTGLSTAVGMLVHTVTSVVDQQQSLTVTRTIGVPLKNIARARRAAVLYPLVSSAMLATGLGSLVFGIVAGGTRGSGVPGVELEQSTPTSAYLQMASAVAIAVALAWAAVRATDRTTERLTSDPTVLGA
jgi:hypothetical protein